MEEGFSALTIKCATFVPPVTGASDCITIPERWKEAEQFNTTHDLRSAGWNCVAERTVEILVHESELRVSGRRTRGHTPQKQQPAALRQQPRRSTGDERARRHADEFRIRMEYIRGSVRCRRRDDREGTRGWRDHRIRGTNSRSPSRCDRPRVCQRDDANKMIGETVEFAISGWTQQERNELQRNAGSDGQA